MVKHFHVDTAGQGLHEVTSRIAALIDGSGIEEGLCTVFVRHTSASLVIQENADPTAKSDLERWIARLVPAHIKAALTATSLSIPVQASKLALGTWQGIYLWEHRRRGSRRELVVHIGA